MTCRRDNASVSSVPLPSSTRAGTQSGTSPTCRSTLCPRSASVRQEMNHSPAKKTLILGLGNPLVTDDSVGLRVVERLKPLLADRVDVEVAEDYWGGLRLMERMIGFDRAIVVDAIQTGDRPGAIHLLTPNGIPTQRSASAHDVNLATALEFGRRAGMALPVNDRIQLVGVEVEDVLTFGEQCTPSVQAAIPSAVEAVLKALGGE